MTFWSQLDNSKISRLVFNPWMAELPRFRISNTAGRYSGISDPEIAIASFGTKTLSVDIRYRVIRL